MSTIVVFLLIFSVSCFAAEKTDIVISLPGNILNGCENTICAYTFNEKDVLVSVGNTINFSMTDTDSGEIIANGTMFKTNKGQYRTNFFLKNKKSPAAIKLDLVALDGSKFSFNLKNNPSNALCVSPPRTSVFGGDMVDFNIYVANSTNSHPVFHMPVRVKIYCEEFGLIGDRVVVTNLNGLTRFKTKIDSHLQGKKITFDFEISGNTTKVIVPVLPAVLKLKNYIKELLVMNFPFSFKANLIGNGSIKPFVLVTNENLSKTISRVRKLKIGTDITYNCNGSGLTLLEIWNGSQLINSYSRKKSFERIIIPNRLKTDENLPFRVKIISVKAKNIKQYEYVIPFKKNSKSAIRRFFECYNKIDSNIITPADVSVFSKKSIVCFSRKKTIKNNSHRIITFLYPGIKQSKDNNAVVKNIYFRKEFKMLLPYECMSAKDCTSIQSHCNKRKFWTSYLNSEYCNNSTLDGYLNNALARTQRFNELSSKEQLLEIANLESLIYPISKMFVLTEPKTNKLKQAMLNKFKFSIESLNRFIFVPDYLLNLKKENSHSVNSENILMTGIGTTIESINQALVNSGKLLIKYKSKKQILPVSDFEYNDDFGIEHPLQINNVSNNKILIEMKYIPKI